MPELLAWSGNHDLTSTSVPEVEIEQQRTSSATGSASSLADTLDVAFVLVDNHATANGAPGGTFGADSALVFSAEIRLRNEGPSVPNDGWAIYFSSIRRILSVADDRFVVEHVVGDLHRLVPTGSFPGFGAGEEVRLPVLGEYWMLFCTDVLPRWYVAPAHGDGDARVIRGTDTEDVRQFVRDWPAEGFRRTSWDANTRATPAARYARYAQRPAPAGDPTRRPVPQAASVSSAAGACDLSAGVELITGDELAPGAVAALRAALAARGVGDGPVPLVVEVDPAALTGPAAAPEGYRLVVGPEGPRVTAADVSGARNGVRALVSLVPAPTQEAVVPAVVIEDSPRFAYRGLCLDLARNHISAATVATIIEQMAALRMNTVHLRLSDDEGWRLEIPDLPELTEVGARRRHGTDERDGLLPQLGSGPDDSTSGSGYYTRAEYVDLVRFAEARGITVIPEIDMPAHSRAAVVAMEERHRRLLEAGADEATAAAHRLTHPDDTTRLTTIQYYDRLSTLDPFVPGAEAFLHTVIGAVAQMHAEAGQPLRVWHYGGDEAANVLLGSGFSDVTDPQPDTGIIDRSGQDEPWSGSPAVQRAVAAGELSGPHEVPAWFARRVAAIAAEHGVTTLQAWQDGLKHAKGAGDFPIATRVNLWDTTFWGATTALPAELGKGYEVVVSTPDYLYLDFPAEVHELERGYYWGGRSIDEERVFAFTPENLAQNAEQYPDRDGYGFPATAAALPAPIAGISAAVFGELLRSDEIFLAQVFPRLAAVAERAWYRPDWEDGIEPGRVYHHGASSHADAAARATDYAGFASAVGTRLLPWWDAQGVGYRVPPAGAEVRDGELRMACAFPGLVGQFRTANEQQAAPWRDWTAPVRVSSDVEVRTRTSDGTRFSRSEAVPSQPPLGDPEGSQ